MKKLFILIIVSLFVAGCDSLVDVTPKGYVLPSTAQDLRRLLDNTTGQSPNYRCITLGPSITTFLDEYITYKDSEDLKNKSERVFAYYLRDRELIEDHDHGDAKNLYELVSLANAVLDIWPKTSDLTQAERNHIKGEALVHRAYAYLYLVNIYGKHYDKSTASSDLGISLILTSNINVKIPARSTVQEAYDQILADLLEADPLLGDRDNGNVALPSKGSCCALLSRVYLYMQDFDKALEYADKALSCVDYLYNYNDYWNPVSKTLLSPTRDCKNQEIFMYKCVNLMLSSSSNALRQVSLEFYNLMGDGDLRKENYTRNDLGLYNYNIYPFDFSGILVSEMYVTRAECLARAGKLQDALNDINYLRQHRYLSEKYQPLASTDKNQVMDWVLRERNIELAFNSLNWFDLKRLNKDADARYHKTITRELNGQKIVFEPNSPLWAYPLPGNILGGDVIQTPDN